MSKSIIQSALALLTFAGCGSPYSHCDPTSALHPGITEAQQSACDDHVCDWNPGDPSCSGETGETGEPADGFMLHGRSDGNDWGIPFYWWVTTTPDKVTVFPEDIDFAYCDATSRNFPHVPSFTTSVHDYTGRESVWCGEGETAEGYGDAWSHKWRMCQNVSNGSGLWGEHQKYYPATVDPYSPGEDWTASTECKEPGDPIAGMCSLGLVAVGGGEPGRPQEWTCRCDGEGGGSHDQYCQTGAQCEAGFYIDGMWPRPTLCTWDGAFEQGSRIYGLDAWADGLTIEGNAITMTRAMYVEAFNQRALWNDAQMIEPVGESGEHWVFSECAPVSLCAHLGYSEGDELVFDFADAAGVLLGATVPFTLLRDGEPGGWTFTLED